MVLSIIISYPKMPSFGFANEVIYWFKLCLGNFVLMLMTSTLHMLVYGCHKDLFFLILQYISDIAQAVDCDHTCLFCHHKDLKRIKEEVIKNLSSECDWFLDDKLSIPFGEDQVFQSKNRKKSVGTLDINYGTMKIKQYFKVTFKQ